MAKSAKGSIDNITAEVKKSGDQYVKHEQTKQQLIKLATAKINSESALTSQMAEDRKNSITAFVVTTLFLTLGTVTAMVMLKKKNSAT